MSELRTFLHASLAMRHRQEIASMIGRHLRQCEERGSAEGVRWDEVVTWYLEQRVDDLETEDDFDTEKDIANKVKMSVGAMGPRLYWLVTYGRHPAILVL